MVYDEAMSGGILAAGDISVFSFTRMLGGSVVGGSITPNGTTNEPPFGQLSKGVLVAGLSKVNHYGNVKYTSSGQVSLNSTTIYGIKNYRYNPTGFVSVQGESKTTTTFVRNWNFLWDVNYLVEKDFDFLWNRGQLQIYWYRVVGKKLPGDVCGPLQGSPCCQQFVMNVHARTLTELCEKLTKRKYKFPIQSVQRFSRPAQNSVVKADEANGINHDCNKLTEVAICQIPQCADFCIDQDLYVDIGFEIKALVNAFPKFESDGDGVYVYGSAICSLVKNLTRFTQIGSGSISVFGEAEAFPNHFIGKGGLAVGGTAASQFSRWIYSGGDWPNTNGILYGNETLSVPLQIGDAVWQLTDRIKKDDSSYSQSDLSFGKTSQYLIARNFGISVPVGSSINGIKVYIDRKSSQIGVRDLEVVLVSGNQIISENLAEKNIDWPLIETTKVYGGNGLDGGGLWREKNNQLNYQEINDKNFGVAIRVKSTNPLPITLAYVDYISVQVFYENPQGSIVRVGGEAGCVSPVNHYTGSGSISVYSQFSFKTGYRFLSTGNGAGNLPEIRLSGRSSVTYNLTSIGGVKSSGSSIPTPYFETSSGGSKLSGESIVKPYFEIGSGGVKLSGKSIKKHNRFYQSNGSASLYGEAFTPQIKLFYTMSGGLDLFGESRNRSSYRSFVGSGSVLINGEAEQKPSNLGTFYTSIWMDMEVAKIVGEFSNDIDANDATDITGTLNKCGCITVPLTVNLDQNISRSNLLSQFLARNNYLIPNNLPMKYNVVNDSWQSNLHYRGYSANSNVSESWSLVFELQCTETVGGVLIGSPIWKLAIQILKKNLISGDKSETRILVAVLPDTICRSVNNQIDFKVTFDTSNGNAVVSPNATIYQSVVFDNIGIFKNISWVNNPYLILKVSQANTTLSKRVDLTNSVIAS